MSDLEVNIKEENHKQPAYKIVVTSQFYVGSNAVLTAAGPKKIKGRIKGSNEIYALSKEHCLARQRKQIPRSTYAEQIS